MNIIILQPLKLKSTFLMLFVVVVHIVLLSNNSST